MVHSFQTGRNSEVQKPRTGRPNVVFMTVAMATVFCINDAYRRYSLFDITDKAVISKYVCTQIFGCS